MHSIKTNLHHHLAHHFLGGSLSELLVGPLSLFGLSPVLCTLLDTLREGIGLQVTAPIVMIVATLLLPAAILVAARRATVAVTVMATVLAATHVMRVVGRADEVPDLASHGHRGDHLDAAAAFLELHLPLAHVVALLLEFDLK